MWRPAPASKHWPQQSVWGQMVTSWLPISRPRYCNTRIIRRRAKLPPPLPGQPGPFSLGADGILAAALERAGFSGAEVKAVDSPVRMASAAECVRFEKESFGALHQMMSGMSETEKSETWLEIESELRKFEGPAGFVGPCEMLVGAATR